MVGHAGDDGGDTLIEEGHGGGGVNERDERFHQFLAQSRLQRSQGSKLQGKRERERVVRGQQSAQFKDQLCPSLIKICTYICPSPPESLRLAFSFSKCTNRIHSLSGRAVD